MRAGRWRERQWHASPSGNCPGEEGEDGQAHGVLGELCQSPEKCYWAFPPCPGSALDSSDLALRGVYWILLSPLCPSPLDHFPTSPSSFISLLPLSAFKTHDCQASVSDSPQLPDETVLLFTTTHTVPSRGACILMFSAHSYHSVFTKSCERVAMIARVVMMIGPGLIQSSSSQEPSSRSGGAGWGLLERSAPFCGDTASH